MASMRNSTQNQVLNAYFVNNNDISLSSLLSNFLSFQNEILLSENCNIIQAFKQFIVAKFHLGHLVQGADNEN